MKIYFNPSFIQEPINFATYQEKGQEYLLFWMMAGEFLTFENPNCLLLVPNDSTLAQQIKELVDKDETYYHIFATPAENLRFKSNFYKVKNTTFHGLVIKDTNQVEKIVGNESKRARPEPSQITFKAIKWTKEKENQWGSFRGKLEIEPFSLGIENLPPITCLEFKFITKENPSPGPGDPNVKDLTESELYNSSILPESAGKLLPWKLKSFILMTQTPCIFLIVIIMFLLPYPKRKTKTAIKHMNLLKRHRKMIILTKLPLILIKLIM
ncbi:hypothetical protein [endosymbiont GvMRE of Glomus versiforme]|uniref:hypothetical protein n=1 Tax=endosymbiont GvMRE of Glomus versiforme TaxID=2039283 RepID=UPI000EEDEA44|nr:hypothetical protein [endosymbiont GvMRE of Glomus versiforme]RHZ37323.1 hypothetical protein GvMRE_I1g87 [endosymbiont GvMRE of Glomus versiforme]